MNKIYTLERPKYDNSLVSKEYKLCTMNRCFLHRIVDIQAGKYIYLIWKEKKEKNKLFSNFTRNLRSIIQLYVYTLICNINACVF